MTELCARCAHLFGDCQLLAGQLPCALQPKTYLRPRLSAAIAINHRTLGFRVEPILVTDFYPNHNQ